MYKLKHYRCTKCDYEEDRLMDEYRTVAQVVICPDCREFMKEFNFKNNKHRVYIEDPQR